MGEIIVKSNNLTKCFGKKKAVDGVSLTVRRGEIYGFIGRNGAGKTTFMRMLCGLASPTSGDIELFGETGYGSAKMQSRIGCLIEAPGLYPNMTAYDNLRLKQICAGISKNNYIEELLDLVGLKEVAKKKTKTFSLGMKQRLGIAMALVGEPDMLVLDEPINGLDPQGIIEVRDTIQKLNKERNITIMISSHILEELSKVATSYGIINNGQLITQMTREELLAQCCERIVVKLSDPKLACPIIEELGIHNYKVVDASTIHIFEALDRIPEITNHLASANIGLQGIMAENESLEDFYINITGGGAINA